MAELDAPPLFSTKMSSKPVKKRISKKVAKKATSPGAEDPNNETPKEEMLGENANPAQPEENVDHDQMPANVERTNSKEQQSLNEPVIPRENTQKKVERSGPVKVVRDARTNPTPEQIAAVADEKKEIENQSNSGDSDGNSQRDDLLSVVVEDVPPARNDAPNGRRKSENGDSGQSNDRQKDERQNSERNDERSDSKDNSGSDNRDNNERRNRGKNRHKSERGDRNEKSEQVKENKREVEIDNERLKIMAWEIYRSEVCEEGLALLDPRSMRDFARSSFRAARVFLEEEGQI